VAQGFQRPGGKIVDREDDYRRRRLNRIISPTRNDAFAMGDKTPDASVRTFADVMREQQLARERDNTLKNIADKRREEEEELAMDRDKPTKASGLAAPAPPAPAPAPVPAPAPAPVAAGGKRRNRWDQSGGGDPCAAPPGPGPAPSGAVPALGFQAVQRPLLPAEVCSSLQVLTLGGTAHACWWVRHCVKLPSLGTRQPRPEALGLCCGSKKARTTWDEPEATPALGRWDATPGRWDATPGRADETGATPGRSDATPGGASRWDATPTPGRVGSEATPRRNRWDDATPTPGRVRALPPQVKGLAADRPRCGMPLQLRRCLERCCFIVRVSCGGACCTTDLVLRPRRTRLPDRNATAGVGACATERSERRPGTLRRPRAGGRRCDAGLGAR